MKKVNIELVLPKTRSYYWTDAYRECVRTDVYEIENIEGMEIHVPDAAGHFAELRLPDGQEVRIGIVR